MSPVRLSPEELLNRIVAATGLRYQDVLGLRADALDPARGEFTVRWPDGRSRNFRLDSDLVASFHQNGGPHGPLITLPPSSAHAASPPSGFRPEEVRSFVSARRGFSRSFSTVYSDRRRTQVVLEMVEREVRRRAGRVRVLDVGCDRGVALFELAGRLRSRGDVEYVGLDAVAEPLEYVRRRAEFEGAPIRVVHGRMPGSGLEAGSFDVVLCAEVLEHIPFPEDVLGDVRSLLRSGGSLVLSTPNAGNPLARLARRMDRALGGRLRRMSGGPAGPMVDRAETEKSDVYGHISTQSHQEWARILEACAFRVHEVRRGGLWPGAPWLDRRPALFALLVLADELLEHLPFTTSWCWDFAMVAVRG